jgi:hypothetical protein
MSGIDWKDDRRRSTRVDLLAELEGHVVTLDEAIVVRQVSHGGLTIETTAPLSPRLTHEFRVTAGDRTALVRARVAHSRVQMRGDAVSYVSGLEFVEPPPEAIDILEAIVARAQDAQRSEGEAGQSR